MIETITELIAFTLFGSVWVFGLAVLLLIIGFFYSEYDEDGYYAFGFSVAFLILNQFWGDFHIQNYIGWVDIGIYLATGLGFALIRTFFKGRELTKEYTKNYDLYKIKLNDKTPTKTLDEYITEKKGRFNLKEHVFRWWFLFPIAMLSWIFGTVLKDVYSIIYDKIGGVFTKILNL